MDAICESGSRVVDEPQKAVPLGQEHQAVNDLSVALNKGHHGAGCC